MRKIGKLPGKPCETSNVGGMPTLYIHTISEYLLYFSKRSFKFSSLNGRYWHEHNCEDTTL